MESERYHTFFDKIYYSFLEDQEQKHSNRHSHGHSHGQTTLLRKKSKKYTLTQNNLFYRRWNFFKLLNCLISMLIYPFYTVNGFPFITDENPNKFWFIVILESFFGLDIILNFFMQQNLDTGAA